MQDQRVRGLVPGSGPPAPTVYDVVGVVPRKLLKVRVLGDALVGLPHHWVADEAHPNGRSRLCTQMEEDCPYHTHRAVRLWYLPCMQMPAKKRVILRVGEECAGAILRHCGKLATLRGAHLSLTAEHDGEALRAIVEDAHEINFDELPKPHRMEHTLRILLGLSRPLNLENYEIGGPNEEVPLQ